MCWTTAWPGAVTDAVWQPHGDGTNPTHQRLRNRAVHTILRKVKNFIDLALFTLENKENKCAVCPQISINYFFKFDIKTVVGQSI